MLIKLSPLAVIIAQCSANLIRLLSTYKAIHVELIRNLNFYVDCVTFFSSPNSHSCFFSQSIFLLSIHSASRKMRMRRRCLGRRKLHTSARNCNIMLWKLENSLYVREWWKMGEVEPYEEKKKNYTQFWESRGFILMIENSQHSNSENNMNIEIVHFSESRKTRKNTNVVVVLRIRYLITRFKR